MVENVDNERYPLLGTHATVAEIGVWSTREAFRERSRVGYDDGVSGINNEVQQIAIALMTLCWKPNEVRGHGVYERQCMGCIVVRAQSYDMVSLTRTSFEICSTSDMEYEEIAVGTFKGTQITDILSNMRTFSYAQRT